jgi:hypothetical protein
MSRVNVEIISGPSTGKNISLTLGQVAHVGRSPRATLGVPKDSVMSDLHFSIEFGLDTTRAIDLNSGAGIKVNGRKVAQAVLKDGDQIAAGSSTFRVRFIDPVGPERVAITALPHRNTTGPQDLPQILHATTDPLYALLDAARDARVLGLLSTAEGEWSSLYDGAKGAELAAVAPHLVRLTPGSQLLDLLVQDGFGRSWGIYLTSKDSFSAVRRHFRKFLIVKTEDGKQLYFRFYDPRVLRNFLPACNSAETVEFFGPVTCFMSEGEDPTTLLIFSPGPRGAQREVIPVFSRTFASAAMSTHREGVTLR